MTAIAGVIHLDEKPVDPGVLERMVHLLAPYGRDAQHRRLQPHAGFLRTLLRITPEDSFDQQPLWHGERATLVLFDGRIDNRAELARHFELEHEELHFMADSELALRACLRWDTAAAEHLLGDFAIACWQARRRRLWLARDPLGTRPLFWYRRAGLFAFASMPKALFAIPGVPRAICEERLADQLMLLPQVGPESPYKDVFRVEPGQRLLLEDEHLACQHYHRFDAERELSLPTDDDYVEAFREHVERAVARRLRAAGPIASHLSSGFDSATVTALAARQLAERNQRLTAYTAAPRVGFDGPVPKGRHADESVAAAALAARFANIDHVLIRTPGTTPLEPIARDTETLERPLTNPCNFVWIDAIDADAERRGARVLLTGQLGNMTLSYTGEPLLASLLGRGQWLAWWREALALKRAFPRRRWLGLLAQSAGPYLPANLWRAMDRLRSRNRDLASYSAIHPAFRRRMRQRVTASGWDLSYRPWADGRAMRIAVLNRIDAPEAQAAANLYGFEKRDPTGDLRLIEFCLAVPDGQYLRRGHTRWLLRRMMGDILPPEITEARTKGLQAADWYEGAGAALPQIRQELQRLTEHGSAGKYLDLEALSAHTVHWPKQGWERHEMAQQYRLKLLRGLAVGSFVRMVETDNA